MVDIKVRFPPSPTGNLHVGSARTALFNFLFARKNKGKLVLRIEDTDKKREVKESYQAIYDSLKWLGINWDEGPILQSDRLKIYKEHAEILLNKGLAYESEGAIYLKTQKDGQTKWVDLIGNKEIVFDNNAQEDFVIFKSDSFPTYHLANVVDDHLMGITHIIRGQDILSSTQKHIKLYQAFGWDLPQFGHLPMILATDRSKLSKRHGAIGVLDFKKDGFLPEALINYLALLGWTPPSGKEILTISEMIDEFDLKDINIANAIFDIKKLEWMNGVYIRKSKIENLKSKILAQNPKLKDVDSALLDKLIPLAQTRMKTLNDFYDLVKPIVEKTEIKLNSQEKEIAKKLKEQFLGLEDWTKEAILGALMKILGEQKTNMPTVYKIFTSHETGLPLPDVLAILGRENSLEILNDN